MKSISIIFCALLFYTASAIAQKQIKGTVKDNAGKPIEFANVNLMTTDGTLIAYTQTNKDGKYNLTINAVNALSIEATCIGYKKAIVTITDLNKNYDLVLANSEMMLKEVKIKYRPALKLNGDTLNYRAADFAGNQDRSIGDVLKKMPGITVDDDGKISYNGKSISNFYIDGDNLLDDRYNIASRSIPYGAVDQVQVIQKDQPIKMLRKNNTSEDVALNLVIKNEAKLHVLGETTTGLGTPDRFEENGTAILLNKKVKFINNITGNNIGIDPEVDLIAHNTMAVGGYFLSAGAAANPPLPQSRYLFNNAGVINLNNLVNLNKELQLKANIAYLYDNRHQQFKKLSEFFLPGQTIDYTEIQKNTINIQRLRTQLNFLENADRIYFNDMLLLDYDPNKTLSEIINNNAPAYQTLNQQTLNIANNLKYLLKLRSGHMVNLSSTISNISKPESLLITPGLDSAIFNNSIPYAGLNQYIQIPTWNASNYASIVFLKDKFTQAYQAGFDLQHQQLNSELYRVQNNQVKEPVSSNMVNDLDWLKTKFYASGAYSYTSNKITAVLSLPLSFNWIKYEDQISAEGQTLKKLFFDPTLTFAYQTNVQNKISANYSFNNGLGIINNVYGGAILTNYLSLVTNNAPLALIKTQNIGVVYNFTNTTELFFLNMAANYSDMAANTISSTIFNSNIQQHLVLPLPNHNRSLTLSANTSKYLFDFAITVNSGLSYTQGWLQLLQNNELFPSKTQTITYKAGIIGKLISFINWSYNLDYSMLNNKSENVAITHIQRLTQKSTILFKTLKNVYINVSGDYLYTHQPGQEDLKYVFTDMNINFRLLKLKTDIMFSITNLANIKTFNAIDLTANSLTTASYTIPGRVAMLKGTFNF